jgi:hypothetical protein
LSNVDGNRWRGNRVFRGPFDHFKIMTRRWLVSKIAPRHYSDRVATEISGAGGGPIETRMAPSAVRTTSASKEVLTRHPTDWHRPLLTGAAIRKDRHHLRRVLPGEGRRGVA